MELGRVGVWTVALGLMAASQARETVAEIEDLGFGTVWYPEGVGTKEALSQGTMLLDWTSRIVVASGIANIYARDPMAMANGARAIADAYPDRFLLGIGVSHAPSVAARGGTYRAPIGTMRSYIEAMDKAVYGGPTADGSPPRVLAALGPRMLALSAELSLGAHPYFVPVEHTRRAREVLGPQPLLAPEQAVVLSRHATDARRIARAHLPDYLELENYRRNLVRLGWAESELADGGSEALADAIVACGDAELIASRVQAHLDGGADHVCIQVLGENPSDPRIEDLRALAPALLEL